MREKMPRQVPIFHYVQAHSFAREGLVCEIGADRCLDEPVQAVLPGALSDLAGEVKFGGPEIKGDAVEFHAPSLA